MGNKEKKTTLKELTELIQDCNSVNELIAETKDSAEEAKKGIGVQYNMIVNANNVVATKCCNCGHINKEESTYTPASIVCSKCGKNLRTIGFNATFNILNHSEEDMYVCKKFNDAYLIFKTQWVVRSNPTSETINSASFKEGDDNNWLLEGLSLEPQAKQMFFFSESLGFRTEKMYSRYRRQAFESLDTMAYYRCGFSDYCMPDTPVVRELEELLKELLGDKLQTNESGEIIFSNSFMVYNNLLIKQKAEKSNKKKTQDNNPFIGLSEISPKEILTKCENQYSSSISTVLEKNGNDIKMLYGCHCGHLFVRSEDANKQNGITVTCPKCGAAINLARFSGGNSRSGDSMEFFLYEKLDKDIVLRVGKIVLSLNHSDESEYGFALNYSIDEQTRIIFSEKKAVIYQKDSTTNVWAKKKILQDYVRTYSPYYVLVNTEEEMLDIIHSTFLDHTGVEQAWGLGDYKDFRVEEQGEFSRGSYLLQWYQKPWLEVLVKGKLPALVRDLLGRMQRNAFCDVPNPDGKTPSEILGTSKKVFKMLRERNYDFSNYQRLSEICNDYPDFTLEMYDKAIAGNLDNILYNTCRETNTHPKRFLEYMDSCYDNQCIVRSQAAVIFSDYYRMAKDCGFNISDKHVKFPNSLKKEHDKAIFAYKIIADEIKKKKFIDNVTKDKIYEFSTKDFAVIMPKSPDEVVLEGQLQRHCVSSYVTKIENGVSCICFLRKKDDMETPFYTCEIYNGSIFQVKGFQNKYPSEKDVIEFIHKWADKKGLKEDYMRH